MSEQPNTATTSVDIAADAEAVWAAITTDEGLAPWLGDGASIDARPGGALTAPDPVGGQPRRGRVAAAEPSKRLDAVWWPVTRPAERTEVSIRLEPCDTGTRVTVIERRPAPVTASTTTATTATTSGAAMSFATSGAAMIAGWSWRLAMLSLVCQTVRC